MTMSDNAPKAPAGWYPDPSGVQRYWDGEQWLDIAAPEAGSVEPGSTQPGSTEASDTKPRNRRTALWAAIIVGSLVVVGGAAGLTMKLQHDAAEAEKAATAEAAAEAGAEEQDRIAAEEERQAAADERERDARETSVTEIEESIKTMAEEHVADDLIDGPILEVSCDPVEGGSADDLSQKTTVFQCFVANEDNGDGTLSGYYYNATMNWDSGEYTYGFGEP